MLKMAGESINLESKMVVVGKHGCYRIKNEIGNGGNGTVFDVEIINGDETLPNKRDYVIKTFKYAHDDEKEYLKRRSRFIKEIATVLSFQEEVKGIIPIFDTSIYRDTNQEPLWYIMPKADKFRYKSCESVEKKLEHMLILGDCLKQLHSLGYAHRDIKPNNLLVLDDRLCLADFGLVWNANGTDEQITEVNDRLGPYAIQPPELQQIAVVKSVDYRKSDVYLFAKTIWIVLKNDVRGFPLAYSRADDHVYIDKEKYQLETAEPLHLLMEGATEHNWENRIDIGTCLFYIKDQLRVIRNDLPQERLTEYSYKERLNHLDATILPNEKVYRESSAIIRILNEFSGTVSLVFIAHGVEFCRLPLVKANHIHDKVFEIEILNPYDMARSKTIELAIENVSKKDSLGFEIQSETYSFEDKLYPEYTHIIEAMKCVDKRVRLNAGYLTKMVQL
jgi:serine/threonine-protein kinase